MSQNAAILKHLESGKTLTPLEALRLFSCLRLAARIEQLRMNHTIECRMVKRNGKRFGEYRMVK